MNICTIVAHNYLAHARVLAESFTASHPGSTCVVLVIDEHDGHLREDAEPFTLVTPADLPFDEGEFADLSTRYEVIELSTAVKPWLLRHMLDHHDDGHGIAYFDPDILVHTRMTELEALLRKHPIVLTPHLTEPMPRDGRIPDEQAILIAGTYNLGFIGLSASPQADRLVDWWSERLRTDCVVAPAEGLFVDQRWIDFVPGLFPETHILHDPSYNIAYWNIATRELGFDEVAGRYTVNDSPLRFFHFSGYSPERPDELSKHQNRTRLDEHPVIKRICDEYAAALRAAGWDKVRTLPYELDRLPSGERLDVRMRRLYREARETGELPRHPGDTAGFLAWLQEPARAAPGVNRYLYDYWNEREDVRRAYPRIDGADLAGFQEWCWVYGQEAIPEALMPPRPAAIESTAPPATAVPATPRRFGVNVVGYLRAELGVGEVARQVIRGLNRAAVPTYPVALPVESSRQEHHYVAGELGTAAFGLNLVCVNADMVPWFAEKAGNRFFEGRKTVGIWWWELDTIPPRFAEAFHHVDEVWVGSQFIADALAAVAPVPVLRMPLPLEWPEATPLRPGQHAWPEGYTFLCSYDYNSVFQRKNPLGVVEAYRRAFDPDEGAALVLKSINHTRHPELHAEVVAAASGRPDIVIMDGYLPAADKDRLMASGDCYVSLHRSEGFGLTMAEAMWHGRPVIATGYSGNLDFVSDRTGWLVDHALVPVGSGADPYPPEARWAEPDLDDAARAMRAAFEDPREAARRGAAGARFLRETYSPEAAGCAMRSRLEVLQAGVPDEPPHTEVGDWLATVANGDRSRVDLRTHFPGSRSRLGRIGRLARGAARRAMLPYTWHQDRINRELADAIELANRRSAEALSLQQERATLMEAQLLRDLRSHEEMIATLVEQLGVEQQVRQHLEQHVRERIEGELGFGLKRLQARAFDLPVPQEPWTFEYNAVHRACVTVALDDPGFQRLFHERLELPSGYGVGLDERVIEYPWVLAQDPRGIVLDAGSVLNHAHIVERFRPRFDALTIATLVTEDETFPDQGIAYVDADLRDLPFADGTFDTTICVSTLEHVGMDNTGYGSDLPAANDPGAEARKALAELLRVTKPGGKVLVTVPFGRSERLGWLRVLGPDDLDALLEDVPLDRRTVEIFGYSAEGWQRHTVDEVRDARYRDYTADRRPVDDAAAAARAVACVSITA